MKFSTTIFLLKFTKIDALFHLVPFLWRCSKRKGSKINAENASFGNFLVTTTIMWRDVTWFARPFHEISVTAKREDGGV